MHRKNEFNLETFLLQNSWLEWSEVDKQPHQSISKYFLLNESTQTSIFSVLFTYKRYLKAVYFNQFKRVWER